MWFALLLLLLPTPASRPEPQGQTPPGTMEAPAVEADPNDKIEDAELNKRLAEEAKEFDSVNVRYENAVAGYRFEIREMRDAGMDRSEYPPSPLLDYLPVFSALGEGGNGAAVFWLIDNAADFIEDKLELANFLRVQYGKLAKEHASGDYIRDAMTLLMKSRRLLGEPFVFEVLHGFQSNSRRRKTMSMALHLEASALVAREGGKDPLRRERAEEIWRTLVDGYSSTKAAQLAGTPLLDKTLENLRRAHLAWARNARQLNASGQDSTTWGALPLEPFRPAILAIVGTKHPTAERWANKFYPAMEQAQRAGTGPALVYEADWLTRQFGAHNVKWVELKFELVNLVFESFPNDSTSFEMVAALGKRVYEGDAEIPRAALENLLSRSTDPRIIAEANLVLAQLLTRSNVFADFDRATKLFKLVGETAPELRQREEAKDMGLQYSWTMPGAVHSTLNLTDSDKIPVSTFSYRGRVLYLFFWSLDIPGCKEELPFVNELAERYADAPVSVLGINGEMLDQRGYRKLAHKHGMTWRNVLSQERWNLAALTLAVFKYPQGIVIDDKGVIRGRGLDHEETLKLIDKLVVEIASREKHLAEADTGRVRGLVRYGGTAGPLPPLEIEESRVKACSNHGGPLDLTDRSRMVAENGALANVVLTVQVADHIASGEGTKTRVQRRDCRYEPHVQVIPQGAQLELTNGDEVPHGAGARSLHNSSFNVVLPPGASHRTPVNAVDRFELTSSTNPWMSSWVVVTDTPFYAVSNAAGEFSIPGLPPGKYVADWWQESLGTGQTLEFEIKAGGTALIELVIGGE